MCACWLKRDIDSAVFLYRAELKGWRVVFNKKSEDGSAKANIEESPDDSILGVIYEIDEAEKDLLDGKEGKYKPLAVSVTLEDGSTKDVVTYKSDHKTAEPPYEWYKEIIIRGAEEHGLSKRYIIKELKSIKTKKDYSRNGPRR